jgi:hypothetical protein
MKANEAIKFMTETGKPVKLVDPTIDPINNRGYYRLYRNDTILKLIPDTACAATVWTRHSVSGFARMENKFTFEPYDPI